MCHSPTYHHYQQGAWAVNCSWPGFQLDAFSKDHQQARLKGLGFLPCVAAQEGVG